MSSSLEAYLCLAGGFLYHLVTGCVFLFGAISVYVASYYRQYDPASSTRLLMLFLPIRGLIVFFTMPMGAYLNSIWPTRRFARA